MLKHLIDRRFPSIQLFFQVQTCGVQTLLSHSILHKRLRLDYIHHKGMTGIRRANRFSWSLEILIVHKEYTPRIMVIVCTQESRHLSNMSHKQRRLRPIKVEMDETGEERFRSDPRAYEGVKNKTSTTVVGSLSGTVFIERKVWVKVPEGKTTSHSRWV